MLRWRRMHLTCCVGGGATARAPLASHPFFLAAGPTVIIRASYCTEQHWSMRPSNMCVHVKDVALAVAAMTMHSAEDM